MGMFGEIATEGMGDDLMSKLEKKARECRRDRKTLELLIEVAGWIHLAVDYPSPKFSERVARFERSCREKS